MRKFMLLLSLVALAAPVAAFADPSPTPAQTANAMCAAAKTSMGATTFTATYGTNASKSNAFGKCVSSHAKAAQHAVTNAAKSCKAQAAATDFASTHGGKTFDQFYGSSNGKGSPQNAMGKCVSQAVQSAVAAQAKASNAALKSCKAAMKADKAAFATTYGTGKDALGKCVAAKSGSK
jgi:hypothetical protein